MVKNNNNQENNNKINDYKKKLAELEASKLDASTNYKSATEFMAPIIKDDDILLDDKTSILKDVCQKFLLNEEQQKQLGGLCKQMYSQTQQSKDEYMKKLLSEISYNTDSISEISPCMDYTEEHGLNYMAMMKNKDNKKVKCFVSSKKDCYKYEDCEENGIYLKHKNNQSKFYIQAFLNYATGKDDVSAGGIFDVLKDVIKKYIIFPFESLYDVVSIWIMHTYVYCLFRYVPYIWLNAQKGSGKTTVLEVIMEFAFNGDTNLNSTPASLFRTIENNGSALFLDEFEDMTRRRQKHNIRNFKGWI